MYGPVRTVVWEGRSRKAPPYPDRYSDGAARYQCVGAFNQVTAAKCIIFSGNRPDSLFEAFQRFRRDRALDAWTSGEAEPEKLPLLRSCHRTLRLIYLEFELL